jgi:minor curlin subunit
VLPSGTLLPLIHPSGQKRFPSRIFPTQPLTAPYMKTLKLQLLAASMFACTAAFAQSPAAPAAPAPRTLTPTPNTPVGSTGLGGAQTSATTEPSRLSYQTGITNDANIQQSNVSQYANINQTAVLAGNTADIYQIGSDHNNATITQFSSPISGGNSNRNTARIDQTGTYSTADQNQRGTGNDAYATQEGGTGTGNNNAVAGKNSSYQRQTGSGNYEYVSQNGVNNYAKQTQNGGGSAAEGNQAEIFQSGNNKTSIQNQDGFRNVAVSDQAGTNASYSNINQQGTSNQAFVTQR